MPAPLNRKGRQALKKANKSFPTHLVEIKKEEWPNDENKNRFKVFRSRRFFVQVFKEDDVIRLSVCRTEINPDGNWKDNITWEDLQQLKRQAGFGNHYAVEVYPRDCDIVNVANMRHIWVLEKPLDIGWNKEIITEKRPVYPH